MHPHDQTIEDFQALKPHLFTSFLRLDLREQYSFDIFEPESFLQLWFGADDVQEVKKHLFISLAMEWREEAIFTCFGHVILFLFNSN
jgi:hypothetical protein